MTFEADLQDVIELEVPRVFAGFAKVTTAKPYATYQQIGGQAINPLNNSAPGLRHCEVQINVWAASYKEAIEKARAVEARMRAATAFTAKPLSEPFVDFDADIPVYGAKQDFACWHRT